MILLIVLKIVHVAAASVWIGGSLTAPSDIQRTLTLGPPHTGALMPRLRRISQIMNQSALATFLTGVLIIAVVGQVPHRIHVSIVLTLLAVAAGRWMIRPVLGEIAKAIAAPVETGIPLATGSREAPRLAPLASPITPEQLSHIMFRFRLVNGVEHALRLAVLVLMVYPFTF